MGLSHQGIPSHYIWDYNIKGYRANIFGVITPRDTRRIYLTPCKTYGGMTQIKADEADLGVIVMKAHQVATVLRGIHLRVQGRVYYQYN